MKSQIQGWLRKVEAKRRRKASAELRNIGKKLRQKKSETTAALKRECGWTK